MKDERSDDSASGVAGAQEASGQESGAAAAESQRERPESNGPAGFFICSPRNLELVPTLRPWNQ